MYWIDGHIDVAYVALLGRNILEPCIESCNECISIPDLVASPISTFFGTIYTAPNDGVCGYGLSDNRDAAFAIGKKQLDIYENLEQQGYLHIQRDGCKYTDTLSMLLLMEGADPIRSPEEVSWWRDQGLRIVGLTWAAGTRYAGGNDNGGRLTEEGKELVAAFDDYGIVHDASHLSDEALDDLLDCSNGMIVASHSNSRTVLNNNSERHLRDDHAKEIFKRGGVIGLNLCNQFLSKEFCLDNTGATLDDCVTHVLHFCNIAGNRRQVCLGSDFDGGFSTVYLPTGLKHPKFLGNLSKELQGAGFSEDDIHSFAHGAWENIFS